VELLDLGTVSFEAARKLQEEYVSARKEAVLVCQHEPCITAGKRSSQEELSLGESLAASEGLHFFQTDRGGRLTYHGPGQLVLYPVVDLRRRRLGLRNFVECSLGRLTAVCAELGVSASSSLEEPGIWRGRAKLGSVGLRILSGMTNHGFSLNLTNELGVYKLFSPCGLVSIRVSSLAEELAEAKRPVDVIPAPIEWGREFTGFLEESL